MRNLLVAMLCLCPIWVEAQSVKDIRQAMDAFDYEIPITQIAPAIGDSVLTPLRAEALKAMNRYAEALKEWNSLLSPDSTETKVLAELGECYRRINQNGFSARCYAKAVALKPENKYFRQQHIRTLLSAEDYQATLDAAYGWLDRDTVSPTGYLYLGMAYEGLSKEDPDAPFQAYIAYNTAYSKDSLDGQIVARLAAIYNNDEQYIDAVEITETYRQTDTTHVDVNRQNAKAYCMMKDYEKAIARYEVLKASGDKSFTTLYYLGMSHYGKEWFYGAEENLSLAYKINPKDVNLLYYLAKSCSRTSWKKRGVEYMQEAINIVVPTDSVLIHLYEGLSDCYSRWYEGDPYKKIEVLKKTYALNKRYTMLYRIAEIYDKQKDDVNAIYYYEKFMSLVPEDKKVILDSDGNPSKNNKTWYQNAERRIKEMKEESFFRDGVKK